MASCIKCGKPKLNKRPDGPFACKHCGVMPGPKRLNRSGEQNYNRSIGAGVRSTSQSQRHGPASDVEALSVSSDKSEKVAAMGKDCNALGLAARVVKYLARRGASHRAFLLGSQ